MRLETASDSAPQKAAMARPEANTRPNSVNQSMTPSGPLPSNVKAISMRSVGPMVMMPSTATMAANLAAR